MVIRVLCEIKPLYNLFSYIVTPEQEGSLRISNFIFFSFVRRAIEMKERKIELALEISGVIY